MKMKDAFELPVNINEYMGSTVNHEYCLIVNDKQIKAIDLAVNTHDDLKAEVELKQFMLQNRNIPQMIKKVEELESDKAILLKELKEIQHYSREFRNENAMHKFLNLIEEIATKSLDRIKQLKEVQSNDD